MHFRPWRLPETGSDGLLTSSVPLIVLLAAAPGARADAIPDWNPITANDTGGSQGWDRPGSQPGLCDGARRDVDAVNDIDRGYHPYATGLEAAPRRVLQTPRPLSPHIQCSWSSTLNNRRCSTPRWRHR